MSRPKVYPRTKLGYNPTLRFYMDTIDVDNIMITALRTVAEKRGLTQRDIAESWIEATLIELESKGQLKKETK